MSRRSLPAAGAALVFVFGFATMLLWWALAYRDVVVPSFPNYLSGTIGDGVLLPVLIYGLLSARSSLPVPERPSAPAISIAGGALAAISGAATQVAWLTDARARQNWMLAGHLQLTGVGWYHAAFLVVVSAGVGYLVVDLLLRLSTTALRSPQGRGDVRRLLQSAGCALTLLAGLLFALTIALDSSPSWTTTASRVTVAPVAGGLALALGLLVLLLGRTAFSIWQPLATALLGCAAFALIVLTEPAFPAAFLTLWYAAAVAAGIGCAYSAYAGELILSSGCASYVYLPVASVLVAWSVLLLPAESWLAAAIVLVALTAVLFVVERLRPSWIRPVFSGVLLALVLGTVWLTSALYTVTQASVAADINLIRSVVSGFGLALLGKYVTDGVKVFWTPLVAAERTPLDERRTPLIRSRSIAVGYKQAFIPSIGLGFGAFFALLPLIIVAVDNSLDLNGVAGVDTTSVVVLLASAAALLTTAFPLLRMSFVREDVPGQRKPHLSRLWLTVVYVLLATSSIAAGAAAIRAGWHGLPSVFAGVLLAILAVDTFETTLVNSTLLCDTRPGRTDIAISGLAATAGSLALYWSLFSGYADGRAAFPVAALYGLLMVFVRFLYVLTAGSVIYLSHRGRYLTDHPPGWNHRHDELTRTMLYAVVVWVPLFAYTHSITGTPWYNIAIIAGAVIALATGILPWSSEQYFRHYDDQRKLYLGSSGLDDDVIGDWLSRPWRLMGRWLRSEWRTPSADRRVRFVRALGAHLSFQIVIRSMLVVATVVGLAGLLVARAGSGTDDHAGS